MLDPQEQVERELLDLAHGNRGQANLVAGVLRQLADQDLEPDLREMAHEVLDGRTTLRKAVTSGAYSAALTPQLDAFLQWYRQAGPEERQAQMDVARAQFDRQPPPQ